MSEMKSLKFGIPKRKRFSIDGDESRFVELDTGDTGIVTRWNEIEPWFKAVSKTMEDIDLESIKDDEEKAHGAIADIAALEKELREKLNFLFDSDVCTPIVGEHGSLLRPVDGEAVFFVILSVLIPLYEADIKIEAAKSQKRIAKHTSKYTK